VKLSTVVCKNRSFLLTFCAEFEWLVVGPFGSSLGTVKRLRTTWLPPGKDQLTDEGRLAGIERQRHTFTTFPKTRAFLANEDRMADATVFGPVVLFARA
jgi:hypothetical protein